MITITLPFPGSLGVYKALEFLNELDSAMRISDEVVIDFSTLNTVEPFSMLKVISGFEELRRSYPAVLLTARGISQGYAGFMGFYHYCGFQVSGKINYKAGNPRYRPITKIQTEILKENAILNARHYNDEVLDIADDIAFVLSRTREGEIFNLLSYSICEIMRNVLEHSEAPHFLYSAQYWPTKDKVEIGIIDNGQGLLTSLNRNPKYNISTDLEAVNYALTPGVTGVTYAKPPKGRWFNQGFGLYMTSRLCDEGGSFMIMSGNQGLYKRGQKSELFSCQMQGTGVRLVLQPSKLLSLSKKLQVYREDADKIIKANGGVPSGDSPSTVLRVFDSKRKRTK